MGEIHQRAPETCWTVDVDAIGVDPAFDVLDGRVADRTLGGHLEDARAFGMFGIHDDFGYVGNDVASALYFDPAAGADVEPCDLIFIEEANIGDGGAAD